MDPQNINTRKLHKDLEKEKVQKKKKFHMERELPNIMLPTFCILSRSHFIVGGYLFQATWGVRTTKCYATKTVFVYIHKTHLIW